MKILYPKAFHSNYTSSVAIPGSGSAKNKSFFTVGLPGSIPFVLLTFVFIFFDTALHAQAGISNFTYLDNPATTIKTYTGAGSGVGAQSEYKPSSNNVWTYNFGLSSGLPAGSMSVNGYIADGSSFSIVKNIITSVVMRRVNNSVVSGNRDILSFTGTRDPGINTSGQKNASMTMNLNADYVADMGDAFSDNNLMIGTDNIFSNQGNGNDNNNNIERVDVLIAGGFLINDAHRYGFPILERGTYGAHDAFKIAVITGVNSSGEPSSYSRVISVTAYDYNNTNSTNPVADGTYTYFLFRRDGTNNLEINQHVTGQGIGGVGFRFSDFGISNGATIYGYSIMANDFTGTSGANVIDYTNTAYFPTNTNENIGGLDPLAVMGISMETMILPVQMTSFTVTGYAERSELKWTTMTEISNKGFYIERSTDAVHWKEIAFVATQAANGSSTSSNNYVYQDASPLPGNNYYRIRQVDQNNKAAISEARMVSFKNASAIKTFPNPVTDNIYIQGAGTGNAVTLLDIKGAVISRVTATANSVMLSSGKLSPGIYFVRVSNAVSVIKTMKIVKI